jgi:hypothetical protein
MGKRIREKKGGVLYSSLENSFGIFRDAQLNLWKFLQRGKEKESFDIKTKKSAISCKNRTISCGVRSKQE